MSLPPAKKNRASGPFPFLGSMLAHASLIALLLLLFRHPAKAGGSGGENGNSGTGGTEIDISLASPEPGSITDSIDPSPAPRPDEPRDDQAPLTIPAPSAPHTPSYLPFPQSAPSTGRDETTNAGRKPFPTLVGNGAGIDGESIGGQRALLPKAAFCEDPVAGKWEALKFTSHRGDWIHFVLSIHRDGTILSGRIVSHIWTGNAHESVPPPCDDDGFDETYAMSASGVTNGVKVSFAGADPRKIATACTIPGIRNVYAADHITGTIDSSVEEFQSVNNDGLVEFGAPYVFRRTACE